MPLYPLRAIPRNEGYDPNSPSNDPEYASDLYRIDYYHFNTGTELIEHSQSPQYSYLRNFEQMPAEQNSASGVLGSVCKGFTKRTYTYNSDVSEQDLLNQVGVTWADELNSTECGYVPPKEPTKDPDPEPLPGACSDPDADNYGSTENEGVCTFSPKLVVDALPDLVALGRPVNVVLHSAEVKWSVPAKVTARITVGNPGPGQTLYVNGYAFQTGSLSQPGRFEDAETLADALLSTPALAAAYVITLAGPQQINLVARRTGRRFKLELSSTSAEMQVATTAGLDTYYSERREEWGLWLEVYALPSAPFGPGQSKAGAELAGRFESRYREDNAYGFDIASCLRQFTGLSYAGQDRLTGYYLRFGETYAASVGSYRRRRVVGETPVLFGLEAVEIMPAATVVTPDPVATPLGFPYVLPFPFGGGGLGQGTTSVPGWRRLSRRPGRAGLTGFLTSVLNPAYSPALDLSATVRSATGESTQAALVGAVASGRVSHLRAEVLGASAETERATVSLSGAQMLKASPRSGVTLSFANGQGGMESVSFEADPEPAGKRTLNQFGTSTGQRTYSAELPEAWRYATNVLSAEEWQWLRDELGNSPAVWLETDNGPQEVSLTDFDASSDVINGTYTLSVVVEFCEQPARGMTS